MPHKLKILKALSGGRKMEQIKMEEIKNKSSFETALKKVASIVEADAREIPEKAVTISYDIDILNALLNSEKIRFFSVNKDTEIVRVKFNSEFITEYIGSIYNEPVENIEQVLFRHRKDVSFMLAYIRIAKAHLKDVKTLLSFLASK